MEIILPSLLIMIFITVVLAITAYTDYKHCTVSSILLGSMPVCVIISSIFFAGGFDFLGNFIGFVVAAIPFLILAIMGKGGGGDVIMMGSLGWCIGLRGITYVILFSSSIYTVFAFVVLMISKIRHQDAKMALKRQYPYAPFVLVGWLIYIAAGVVF